MADTAYYTVEELSALLKVTDLTIRRLIARGELKATKVGRQHRVSATDLDNYLKSQESAAK